MTDEQKQIVVDAMRQMVRAKITQWDHDLIIEEALGVELYLDELVADLATGLQKPDDALTIAESDIIPAIEAMLL